MHRWHPVTALVTCIVWLGFWITGATLNLLVVESWEIAFNNVDSWRTMVQCEVGFQFLLALTYLAMMGWAAAAVHRWRKAKKQDGEQVQLKSGDDDGSMRALV